MAQHWKTWVVCSSVILASLVVTPSDSEGGWRRARRAGYYGYGSNYGYSNYGYSGTTYGGWQQTAYTQPTWQQTGYTQPTVTSGDACSVQQTGYAPQGGAHGTTQGGTYGSYGHQSGDRAAPPPPVDPNAPRTFDSAPEPEPDNR